MIITNVAMPHFFMFDFCKGFPSVASLIFAIITLIYYLVIRGKIKAKYYSKSGEEQEQQELPNPPI